ncbi:MAG: hypothetical protein J0I41_20845 [Filimonas sp.]|nr:hypothetical protein [Filimonas sp.]
MFKKRKERKISTTFSWRMLYCDLMHSDEELKRIISNGLISIDKILISVDCEENRTLIKEALQKGDMKSLKRIMERIPLDYDTVDYPQLSLFSIVTDAHRYFVILAHDEKVSAIVYKEILEEPRVSLDSWEIKMQIFPLNA